MRRLLADCGNTTIKLGLADGAQVLVHDRLPAARASLDNFLVHHGAGVSELILLPGNKAHGEQVRLWWNEVAGAGRPVRVIGEDLHVPDYGQYANCGYDRVLAGAVTCLRERASLIVLDAGTATTITAWRFTDERPSFTGGLILPGAQACLDGLSTAAPALPRVHPLGPSASARQRDTVNSMAAAVGIGYGPMVAACLLKLQRETDIHEVVATGGNIQLIVDSRIMPATAHRPALVLAGMAALAEHH